MKKTIIAMMLLATTTIWAAETEPMRYNSPNASAGATAIAATNTYQTTTLKNGSVIGGPTTATSAPSSATLTNSWFQSRLTFLLLY